MSTCWAAEMCACIYEHVFTYTCMFAQGTLVLENMMRDGMDGVAHPTRAEFAVLGRSGLLQRWDMVTHRCMAARNFDKLVRGGGLGLRLGLIPAL